MRIFWKLVLLSALFLMTSAGANASLFTETLQAKNDHTATIYSAGSTTVPNFGINYVHSGTYTVTNTSAKFDWTYLSDMGVNIDEITLFSPLAGYFIGESTSPTYIFNEASSIALQALDQLGESSGTETFAIGTTVHFFIGSIEGDINCLEVGGCSTASLKISFDDGIANTVPEPLSLGLFGIAMLGLAATRRRKAA